MIGSAERSGYSFRGSSRDAVAQPAPGTLRPQFRCEVPYFTGAISTQGASVKMTVVSDGLACVIPNWGVPDDRRNPATAGDIIEGSQHGTAVFMPPAARYIADRGYVRS